MSVVVVGSFVTDCVANCFRAPKAGETVIGTYFNIYLGGKGANQAVASKRMESETIMAGAVGNDTFGNDFINFFNDEGFNTSFIKRVDNVNTGTSLVTVENDGQNRIIMTPGANLSYNRFDIKNIETNIQKCNVVVTQLEISLEVVNELAIIANKYNKKFILNPAPAQKISDDLIKKCYLIIPNETELDVLTSTKNKTIDDYINSAKILLKKGAKNVIVTLGNKGSILVNENITEFVEAYKVNAIDTVGAGDSFIGSLASQLDQNKSLLESMKIATAVSALEVTKKGAIPAIPSKDEVLKFLKRSSL